MIKIALSGKLRSGKTTARELFQSVARDRGLELTYLSLAAPIYEEAYAFYSKHNLVWTTKDRKLLEAIGEALNDKYPHGDKIIELFYPVLERNSDKNIINDDIRRTTQANFFKEQGFVLVRVNADDDIRKSRCKPGEWSEGAITDTELDTYKEFDYFITNNGENLDYLKQTVETILTLIEKNQQ